MIWPDADFIRIYSASDSFSTHSPSALPLLKAASMNLIYFSLEDGYHFNSRTNGLLKTVEVYLQVFKLMASEIDLLPCVHSGRQA